VPAGCRHQSGRAGCRHPWFGSGARPAPFGAVLGLGRAGGGAVASSVGPGKAIVARWIRAEGPAAAPSLCAELGDQAMI